MTIFRKNIITLGIVVCGFSAILTVAALAVIEYQYDRVKSTVLLDAARSLVAALDEDSIADYFSGGGRSMDGVLQNGLNAVRGKGDYRLSLIATNGDVLWDSAGDGRWVNHIDRDEVRMAIEGGEGIARRDSLSTGARQMYVALPIFASGNTADGSIANVNAKGIDEVAGVFRLSVEDASRPPAMVPFLLCAFVVTLAAFAAITMFSRFFAMPLKRLADIAETTAGKRSYQDISSIVDASGEAEELFVLETALRRIAEKLNRGAEQTEMEGRQLLAILNGMSEAVLAMNDNLILYLVNPRARSLFGLADITGSSLLEATRSTELDRAARKVLAEDRSMEMEIKIKTGNGKVRTEQWFQVFATPLTAPSGVVMVMENITRLVKLEQMRKDFVANVSHELRTPIQLIKGFSETLLDNPFDNEEQAKRCIQIIHKNASTMENLTNDLLMLATLEDNADSSPLEEQKLAPLFAEAASLVEMQSKNKKTEILVDCSDDCVAKVHGPFIIQALVNLLDNGIKYSPKKSQVWASAYRNKGKVVLEVKDKGMGIPAEHLGRIFERFYRVDRSHSRETGGTGLGLSIVRHIVLLHNGTAEVESRPGEGSTFRLTIPG